MSAWEGNANRSEAIMAICDFWIEYLNDMFDRNEEPVVNGEVYLTIEHDGYVSVKKP